MGREIGFSLSHFYPLLIYSNVPQVLALCVPLPLCVCETNNERVKDIIITTAVFRLLEFLILSREKKRTSNRLQSLDVRSHTRGKSLLLMFEITTATFFPWHPYSSSDGSSHSPDPLKLTRVVFTIRFPH